MRKLKKGLAVALAMAMTLSMAVGCGDKKNTTGKLDNATQTDATSSDSSTETAEDLTIDEYIEKYADGVTLGEYKGIEYEYAPEAVTADDIQSKVDSFISSCTTYNEDKTSAAKMGDIVNIDFVGSVDGKEFEGGNSDGNGYDLTLGSNSFIDDFEDQIVGHKAGDTFDVNVTFPEDYSTTNTELNGKNAVFKTTVNYIKIPVEPEYNDELVANNTSYKTVDEYEASIKAELEASNETAALTSAQNVVMTSVINKAQIENVPEDEVESLASEIIDNLKAQASSYNFDYATFINYYYGYSDEESFAEYVKQICEESVKEKKAVCAIAKAENITIDADEETAYIKKLADNNSTTEDQIREQYSSEDLMYYTLADKVMTFLLDNGKKVESTEAATEATTASEETTEVTTEAN